MKTLLNDPPKLNRYEVYVRAMLSYQLAKLEVSSGGGGPHEARCGI
jgi:hypothetical protein